LPYKFFRSILNKLKKVERINESGEIIRGVEDRIRDFIHVRPILHRLHRITNSSKSKKNPLIIYKGNCWTQKQTLTNSNDLIRKFLKSSTPFINEFFTQYIVTIILKNLKIEKKIFKEKKSTKLHLEIFLFFGVPCKK
jgi:hypothetical protein